MSFFVKQRLSDYRKYKLLFGLLEIDDKGFDDRMMMDHDRPSFTSK